MRDILSGRRGGLAAGALRGLLAAASVPYAAVMRLRRWAYRAGVLRSRAAGAPVICVGNLTTGGTGKTPTVVWVVRRLVELGRRPAILTRGYKAAGGESDEARLLADLCGVAVVVNADRVAGAAEAVRGGADAVVMDDGFQHRRLRRDLDVVLVDATNPFGYGWCLPRGLLREPPSALRDAHVVVITHSDAVASDDLRALRRRLRRLAPAAPQALAVHKPTHLIDPQGAVRPLDALSGRRVFAFCGLGAPQRFFALLEALGARLAERRPLDDHVRYTPALLAKLAEAVSRSAAELAVTTCKDAVKLAGADPAIDAWQLAVEVEVGEGREVLAGRIAAVAGAAAP